MVSNGNFLENNGSLSDNFEIFYDISTNQTKINILTRESNYDSSISLNGNFGLSIVDHGWSSGDIKLKFYDLDNNFTSGNDILGPLGEWWEQDVVLSGLDNSYSLTGGLGQDVIGGGSRNDILDGGEELFQDEFGNDVDEHGLLALDRLVYYDAPSGINANLITGIVQDGYGSVDQVSNFERFYASYYDDTITLSNDYLRGHLPGYGNDTFIGIDTPNGLNNTYIGYYHLDSDDDVTDEYVVINYDEGTVEKTVIGGEFADIYQDTFTGHVGGFVGSEGNDIFYGVSSGAYYYPVAGFISDNSAGTIDLGYGHFNGYWGDDTIILLGSGEDRAVGGAGKDLFVVYGHGEKDKISGDVHDGQEASNNPTADFDTFVIGGEGTIQITDYQVGEEIIFLDYSLQSQDDITINYNTDLDQTSLSFVSGAVDHTDRVFINGRLEIDSFEQTTFTNEYTQNTIVDNETKDFKIILKNASASLESKATLTASTDLWLSNSLSGELSQWLDGPITGKLPPQGYRR